MSSKRLITESLAPFWSNAAIQKIARSIKIDISTFRFVTPDALVGLCSLVEYIISKKGKKCILVFPQIPKDFSKDLKLLQRLRDADYDSAFYEYNKRRIPFNYEQFIDARNILKFLSFFHNIGFTRIWENERMLSEVTLSQFPIDQIDHLSIYKGQRIGTTSLPGGSYRRYSSIHRIEGDTENRRNIINTIIEEMEERLPTDQLNSPMFQDKEFEEVFVSQLAENIAAHSDSHGYFIARSFSKEDLKEPKFAKRVLPSCSDETKKRCLENGFFEIAIADCGPGICETLREAYRLVRKEIIEYNAIPNPELHIEDIDVMQFAFDEVGSRFLNIDDDFEALINGHTLNLIYQYTRKYAGNIRLISKDICLSFDTGAEIKRGKYGLGFMGKRETGKWFHEGLNMRVLLPHNPKSFRNYPKSKHIVWPDSLPLEKQVPKYWYVEHELGLHPTKEIIRKKSLEWTREVFAKKIDCLVLDFSGTAASLNPKFFIYLLNCIENIMSHIHCWGLNVSSTLLNSLVIQHINKAIFELTFI